MEAIYLIGLIQSLFVSSIFLLKKGKNFPDYILSFYILVLGSFLGFMYFKEAGIYSDNPFLVIINMLYWVWLGPVLFIYIDVITSASRKLSIKHLVHIIPTIIVISAFWGFFTDTTVMHFENYESSSWYFTFATYIWYYNSPIYYLVCIFLLYRHKRKSKQFYSYSENVDLKWLFYLVNGFAAFLIIGLVLGLLRYYFQIELPFGSKHYTWVVMVLYIFGMGYFGYHQKEISHNVNSKEKIRTLKQSSIVLKEKSYVKSGLDQVESSMLAAQLKQIMKSEKPYLDCELNLEQLAKLLETSNHNLSQVINEQMSCNFFEFITKYRIEDVKNALIDEKNRNLKIISIAYDCGFNSKSSFYTLFKKHTSYTPTAFRNLEHLAEVAN